jgi:hypothetical protein
MLIDIFSDFIRNKKDLREYVEIRKNINERGEFNNDKLIKIQENLEKLKEENIDIYNKMYEVLEDIYKQDQGDYIDYPLNFARMLLNLTDMNNAQQMYEQYKLEIEHSFQTIN